MGIQVAECNVVLEREGALLLDDLVEADGGLEVRLLLSERHDGSIWGVCALVTGRMQKMRVE